MTDSQSTDARLLASNALSDRQGMVSARLERLMNEGDYTPACKAQAMELAMGVLRRRRTLDEIIRAFSNNPNQKMPTVVRQLLRMGVYQLIFMDRTPDYAAVNETVEACKRRKPRQSGFVNALLRRLVDNVSELHHGKPPLDRQTIWISDSSYRLVDRQMYPDPEDKPERFFGSVVSLPDSLAKRWMKRRRKLIDAAMVAIHINARPPVVMRVNLARTTVGEIVTELAAAGLEAHPHSNGHSVVLTGGAVPGSLECLQDGRVSPQDATATAACDAMEVRAGMRVLDFCAAPGSKTMQIAEQLGGTGRVVAVDINEAKLEKIHQNIRRCGWDNIDVVSSSKVASLDMNSFDRVLVDAPCSNTGVLGRRAEARWRFDEQKFRKLCADQRQILRIAEMFLAPGGKLLYSTCSVEPQENHNVIAGFTGESNLKRQSEKNQDARGFCDATNYHDGGYWALLG